MKEPYRELTKFKNELQRRLKKEFVRFTITGFDELNVQTTRNRTEQAYDRIDSFNRRYFMRIAREGRDFAKGLLLPNELKRLSEFEIAALIALVMSEYNIVTGYRYDTEWERKRMRYAEGILAAKEANDRRYLQEISKKNANLLLRQSMQAGIDIEDEAIKETLKEAGISEVVWVTEHDTKVCTECRLRDGKRYKIDEVPPKPHINCRCYIKPYRPKEGS